MPEPIQVVVGNLLRERGLTLAVAESCTGGLIGDLITDVPGSSVYFLGGVIAYAYEAKTALLGISTEFLLQHTSVSEPVARAMARGVRERLQSDIGIAVTGIAGPTGGTPEKPVGLTYVALSAPDLEVARQFVWNGTRFLNKHLSAQAALDLTRDYLQGTAA